MIAPPALIAPIVSGLVTLALCSNAKSIANWLGVMDVPDARKQHSMVTPLMGGIVLLLGFCLPSVFLVLTTTATNWAEPTLLLLAAVVAMALVGLTDDRHALSARDRLLVSFLVFGSAAIINPVFNIRVLNFEFFGFELGLGTGWLAVIFTAICSVGLLNAVNMADGKNGLVIGLCIGWCGLLATRAPDPLLLILLILTVVLLILLLFNLRNLLFLGDGGAYGLSTAIGLIAIMTYNSTGTHAGRAIAADELMLLFAVPVLDGLRLTISRIRRGQSPMVGDRDHLHHHLQNKFGWPLGLIFYLAISITPTTALFIVDIH